jgi:type IV pilus assembly protein PilA
MMLNLKRRLEEGRDRESGFTLIELAVVILIMGILMLIAIPTFLGVRKNAQNKSAQSSVRNGLTAAKAAAADDQTYSTTTAASIQAAEPSITVVTTASTGPKVVSMRIDTANGNTLVLAARSQSGDCYFVRDSLDDSGTAATKQFFKSTGTTTANCTAASAPAYAAATWTTKW